MVFSSLNSELKYNRIYKFLYTNTGKFYCITEDDLIFDIIESPTGVQIKYIQKIPPMGYAVYHLFKPESLQEFIKISQTILWENRDQSEKAIFYNLPKYHKIIQRTKQGLVVYDNAMNVVKNISIDHGSETDYFIQHDELYVKTPENKYYHINITTGALTPLKIAQENLHIAPNKNLNNDKLIWNYNSYHTFYVHQGSLFEIQIQHKVVEFHRLINSLPTNPISCISYSPDKNHLIIGTLSNGFYTFNKNEFDIKISPYSDNIFYAQTADTQNHIAYTSRPLQEYKDSYFKHIDYRPQSSEIVLHLDKKKQLWYTIADTLLSLNLQNHRVTRNILIPDNGSKGLGVILERDSNSIYICSNRSLFYYKIDSGLVKLADFEFDLPIKRIYCMLGLDPLNFLLGTSEGIFKYSVVQHQLSLYCLKNIPVRTMFQTHSGMTLAGTYGHGYYALQGNNPIAIPLDKKGNLKATHGFVEDKLGYLWLTSNNGLYKIKLNEIENYVRTRTNTILYYYRYSQNNGLLTNEFNGGCFPSTVQIDASTWSLPSMQGLVWFKPESLTSTFDNSSIGIDKIILNDSILRIDKNNSLLIKPHHFKLSLFLSSPNWSDELNLFIEYKLKNESSWKLLNDNHEPIVIQNLPGGEHELMIRKKNGLNDSSYSSILLTLKVSKRFYEFSWFWPLAVIGLICFIYFLNKFTHHKIQQRKEKLERIVEAKTAELKESVVHLEVKNAQIEEAKNKLKEENDIKKNLLYVLSHDIATPLRYMNLILSQATKPENFSTLDYDDLVDLKISAQNLKSLLDNIVAWIKQSDESNTNTTIQEIDLHKIVNNKIKLFEIINKKKMNTLVNSIPINTLINSDLFIMSMAIQNLVGNAINYTQNGQIDISFLQTTEAYQIIIKDNGIGIQDTKNKMNQYVVDEQDLSLVGYGIGLKITSELLKLIDGEIKLKSNIDSKGTNAIIYIRT